MPFGVPGGGSRAVLVTAAALVLPLRPPAATAVFVVVRRDEVTVGGWDAWQPLDVSRWIGDGCIVYL